MKYGFNGSLLPTLAGASAVFMLAGLVHTNPASAQTVDWQAYNTETLHQNILPAYARFASEARSLADSGRALCQAPDSDSLERTRSAYRSTLNAWQGVSHIQFGPVQYQMRNYSIEYWPDRKGIGRKQLRATLAMPGDTAFDAEFFRQASIALKGFPALEQLLFAPDTLTQLKGEGVYCHLTAAVAGNIASMAGGLYNDWQHEFDAMLDSRAQTDDDEEQTSDIPPLSIDLMKSLVEPLELIRDTKLLAVMGKGPDATYPHRAESWMSEQSLASIRANLDAAYALYKGKHSGIDQLLRQHGEEDLAKAIDQQFLILKKQIQPLGDSLTAALKTHYGDLKAVTNSLKVLDVLLGKAMQALGIQLGFNSRDGD